MDAASIWKEIAVIVAAVSTMAAAVFEVRDRRTKRFTVWGRVFFFITVLSMIGGFYAQWQDNKSDLERTQATQEAMRTAQEGIKVSQEVLIKLQQSTQHTLLELSRVLQPIEKLDVAIRISPDCRSVEYKGFCDTNVLKARQRLADAQTKNPGASVYEALLTTQEIDWTQWPKSKFYPPWPLLPKMFFCFNKSLNDSKKFVAGKYMMDNECDILLNVSTFLVPLNSTNGLVSILYDSKNNKIYFNSSWTGITPTIKTDKILSAPDLPGASIVVADSNQLLSSLTLDEVEITTSRGKHFTASNFKIESNPTLGKMASSEFSLQ